MGHSLNSTLKGRNMTPNTETPPDLEALKIQAVREFLALHSCRILTRNEAQAMALVARYGGTVLLRSGPLGEYYSPGAETEPRLPA